MVKPVSQAPDRQAGKQEGRQANTDRHRQKQTHTDRHRQTQTDTYRHTHRQTQTHTDRHRQTQTDRDMQQHSAGRQAGRGQAGGQGTRKSIPVQGSVSQTFAGVSQEFRR